MAGARIYYTYEWFFMDTGKVFYVGKGKGRRYKERKDRNAKFKNYIAKFKCGTRKVHENLTEEEAYAKEIELIGRYKQTGQCSCNYTDGGDAPPYHAGADAPNSRKVVQLDLEGNYIRTWDYISQVEKELGLSNSRIVGCCKRRYGKKSYGGFMWIYEEEYNPDKDYVYKRRDNSRPILQYGFDGKLIKEWASAKLASDELGLARSSLCYCCKGEYKSCGGYIWRYKEGKRAKKSISVGSMKGIPTPVMQADLEGRYIATFKTASDAMRALGKNPRKCMAVLECCNGIKYSAHGFKWYYEYEFKKDA